MDVGSDDAQFTLDFSATGLDLSEVTVDSGNFEVSIEGQLIRLSKPAWVSLSNPGYIGLHGNNVSALATFQAPSCGG